MKTFLSKLLLLSVAVVAISVTSCKKAISSSDTFTKADLPSVRAGSTWRYKVTDSVNNTIDTVTLTAVSSTTSGSTVIWSCHILRGAALIDTTTYSVSDSLVYFRGSRWLAGYVFRIPNQPDDQATVQDTTISMLPQDVSVLSHQPHFTVLNSTFDVQAFLEIQDIADAYLHQNFEIGRGIGMVHLQYQFSSWSPFQRKGVELIDYHL
ncbi:MAG: hypothetical protein JST90_05420 [Bacteroidetes bacterium]|nr:hypothetical protein [Bacteroidota bacterium]